MNRAIPRFRWDRSRIIRKILSEPAGALALARQGLLKRLAQVELKGMSRLTGLVGVAEMLLQEMGYSAGRMQTLEREAASRRHLLAEQAKQQASLDEKLLHANDSPERSPVTTQLARERVARRHTSGRGGTVSGITRRSDPALGVGAGRLSQDREGAERCDR